MPGGDICTPADLGKCFIYAGFQVSRRFKNGQNVYKDLTLNVYKDLTQRLQRFNPTSTKI